jgi:hypothetical protein
MAVVSASTACRSSSSRRAGTSCASRVRSAVPHTRARHAADSHTPKRALALAAATHTPGAPSAAAFHTPGAPTYGSLWQQEPHTRWAPLRQQPHTHTSRHCPAHPRARAIPSNRWSSRRAFTEGGSLQAHGVMREAGTRARAPARARTFMHRQPSRQCFYPARPLNVFAVEPRSERAAFPQCFFLESEEKDYSFAPAPKPP